MIDNKELYNQVGRQLCRTITLRFSNSFSSAASLLAPETATAIYNIYGFVRIADEVVDTWRPEAMDSYLADLSLDTKRAIKSGFSTNPIIHSFATTVRQYGVPTELIDAFLKSMRMDIGKKKYSPSEYRQYIYGSAEAVGLMCLMVFVEGDKKKYNELLPSAKALGSAFQKINFLRDYASDANSLGRVYFPELKNKQLSDKNKLIIIDDINRDLAIAKPAIRKLPDTSRVGVALAYNYFNALTKQLYKTPASNILKNRISLPRATKASILVKTKISRGFTN